MLALQVLAKFDVLAYVVGCVAGNRFLRGLATKNSLSGCVCFRPQVYGFNIMTSQFISFQASCWFASLAIVLSACGNYANTETHGGAGASSANGGNSAGGDDGSTRYTGGGPNTGGSPATGGAPTTGSRPSTGGIWNTGGVGYWGIDCNSRGTSDEVCRVATPYTVLFLAPLPTDTALVSTMTFEACFNGNCATFVPADTAAFNVSTKSLYSVYISDPVNSGSKLVSFTFDQVPGTLTYQLHVQVKVIGDSGLTNGDVWSLTLRDTASSIFYTTTATAGYQSVLTPGTGDWSGCSAYCKKLTVPITP